MVNENFPKLEDIDCRHTSSQNVKSKWPEFYEYLTSLNYPQILSFSERLYWYFHNISLYPVCKVCGKRVSYINFTKGYHTYCGVSCCRKDPESEEKRKQTNIKKYGTEHPNQSKIVQDKIDKTMMERYGVKHALQNKVLLQKSQKTCEKNYGVKCPSQNPLIVEKQKQTMIEKYGGMGPGSDIIKEKTKKTNLNRYGTEWGWGSNEIRQKTLNTWKEKYGVENPFSSEEIKEKIKQTNLQKYGVENPSHSDQFLQKIYQTKKENNSFATSSIEEFFAKWLTENDIYFERQHHDDLYPFDCDFYFPDSNYYLEIQGNWVHGDHPFDSNNKNDMILLQKWIDKHSSYYDTAVETWSVRDPLKRETAKNSNINWHEAFTTDLNELINECRTLNIF